MNKAINIYAFVLWLKFDLNCVEKAASEPGVRSSTLAKASLEAWLVLPHIHTCAGFDVSIH